MGGTNIPLKPYSIIVPATRNPPIEKQAVYIVSQILRCLGELSLSSNSLVTPTIAKSSINIPRIFNIG